MSEADTGQRHQHVPAPLGTLRRAMFATLCGLSVHPGGEWLPAWLSDLLPKRHPSQALLPIHQATVKLIRK